MKKFLRSAWVQGLLARLVWAYIEMLIVTLRWRTSGAGPADAAIGSDAGFIALFWHGHIPQAIACRPVLHDKARTVMISMSRDGGFIADAAVRLKIPVIRGSTGRREPGGEKGGAAAFRAAMAVIRSGSLMLLTPDGPRGPRHQMQMGPVQLAKATGCPVYLMGLASSHYLRMKSWDEGRIPLPFARAALIIEGPDTVSRNADADAMEAIRLRWQETMDRVGERAEQALLR